MLNENTIKSLLNKFKEKEHYEKRKIIFWYDKDKTVTEDLNELRDVLIKKGIKIKILKDNQFEVKKLLERDDTESDYLIYSEEKEPSFEENWLLNIQLYSSRFESSKIAEIKSWFSIEGYWLDNFLEKHLEFFNNNNKARVESLKKLHSKDWKEDEFILGFLAVLSNSQTLDFKEILKKTFIESLDEKKNTILVEVKKFELEDEFWNLISQTFGYQSENRILEHLFFSFLITHIKHTAKLEPDNSYKHLVNSKENECEIFIQSWMKDSCDSKVYDEYVNDCLEKYEKEFSFTSVLKEKLNNIPPNDYIDAECMDLFDQGVITAIVNSLVNNSTSFKEYLQWIDRRRTTHWYGAYVHIYLALEHAVKLYQTAHENRIDSDKDIGKIFNNYTEKFYLIDLHYRKFLYHSDKVKTEKEILKRRLESEIEKLYANKLMSNLIRLWSKAIDKEMKGGWKIDLVDNQREFYKIYVSNILSKNDRDKVAVIISDGMRYEIAAELRERLDKETKGLTKLKNMLGSVPSTTLLGMAALLPNNSLELKKEKIYVNGLISEGLDNRSKILTQGFKNSIALQFQNFRSLTRDEQRELTKNRVIYIYHNKIDNVGDNKASEHEVVNATEESIEEIISMIKHLSSSLNVTHIIVTSDHGFLYQRGELKEVDKLSTTPFNKDKLVLSENKRYMLTEENKDINDIHKFKMSYLLSNKEEYYAYVPKEDLRFKLAGGGANYVHGGSSLQETVIPVVIYSHQRTETDLEKKGIKYGKVKVTVINPSRRITNNKFTVKIFQTEKVTDKLKPLNCKVYLFDSEENKKISNEQSIIANSTSDNPQEREYKITLTLGKDTKNKMYYLKIIDEDPKAIKKEIEVIPFEVDLTVSGDFEDF